MPVIRHAPPPQPEPEAEKGEGVDELNRAKRATEERSDLAGGAGLFIYIKADKFLKDRGFLLN